jgi:hypothetical protein
MSLPNFIQRINKRKIKKQYDECSGIADMIFSLDSRIQNIGYGAQSASNGTKDEMWNALLKISYEAREAKWLLEEIRNWVTDCWVTHRS